MSAELRQCIYCGRKGTRQFVLAPGAGRGYWCKSERACHLRRAPSLTPFKRKLKAAA